MTWLCEHRSPKVAHELPTHFRLVKTPSKPMKVFVSGSVPNMMRAPIASGRGRPWSARVHFIWLHIYLHVRLRWVCFQGWGAIACLISLVEKASVFRHSKRDTLFVATGSNPKGDPEAIPKQSQSDPKVFPIFSKTSPATFCNLLKNFGRHIF